MKRSYGIVGVLGAFLFLSAGVAEAKCTKRVADPLIIQRYQECNPREMLSYLYNNIVTPYSFDCSKKIRETCKREDCDHVRDAESFKRCQLAYVQVLNGCQADLEGAAKMARCKDTKSWPVEEPIGTEESETTISRQGLKTHAPAVPPAAPQSMRASQSSTRRN